MSWHRVSIDYWFLALSRFGRVKSAARVSSYACAVEVSVVDVSYSIDIERLMYDNKYT